MGMVTQEAIDQLQVLMEEVDEPLKKTFKNVHRGYPTETLARFLKAREGNVSKAHSMLVDCLKWRVENDIDGILAKPIVPTDLYRAIRNSQLIGLSGYSREGLPVFAIGIGTFDKASPSASKQCGRHISKCLKVFDMTGLKLSALSQIKLLTIITTIDDLNYPEKTLTYYIVNAPYIFSACWKVVKPLLHERTRRKVQVLPGCGRDDLLKIMDQGSLPHFCRKEGSGSSQRMENSTENCFSLDHPFHQQLYNYIKQQFAIREPVRPIRQGSVHVVLPDSAVEDMEIAKTLESELQKFDYQDEIRGSLDGLKIDHGK
ncbi:hypothetical protein RHGRI_004161 [Rhododendron griersonianum]|uniref:CRAL-TRIO domain-containing protein n=1 Tax=Rhododendron griersonianum TaxID=479676 RepID=A0AAV6L808_9ERIC|nr:hypothetical protein RHGRI_004161 [Rhododendron griersonianum]KAG5561051.1 hypothetical protein RHGRI_004161 [Rhododendron griersonianum]